MSTEEVVCPQCGSPQWKAVEQFTALTPCTITRVGRDIEIDFDMRAEHVRDAATSVTTAYMCANEECAYVIEASQMG